LNAVAQLGPIAISVDASTWHAYDGGIYNGCNQTTSDIDHAVVLVGYGPGYWLVRNSWSASWGESGYIKLLVNMGNAQKLFRIKVIIFGVNNIGL
jgi:cathepsin L